MDYSLHYDDELTITATFSPNVTPEMAFEFLEFFKTNARLDPLTKRLKIGYYHENDSGYAWSGDIWLDQNNQLTGRTTVHFVGSFDVTPIDCFYPSLMQQFKQSVLEHGLVV